LNIHPIETTPVLAGLKGRMFTSKKNQSKSSRPPLTDELLVKHCREKRCGWENELSDWLAGQRTWLLRRCIARLGNEPDAEDAVQEVSVKVINAIGGFEGRSQLGTWVTRIADNHCYSMVKKRTSSAIRDHFVYSLILIEENRYVSDDDAVASAERSALVQDAIKRLSSRHQEVLSLRFYADLSLEDISQSLDLSLSAAKMRLYRALDALQITYSH